MNPKLDLMNPYPSEELRKEAKEHGYVGFFAWRENTPQAFKDAFEIIEAIQEDKPAALLALMLYVNTNALERAHIMRSVKELRQLARGYTAFLKKSDSLVCEDVISIAERILENAQEIFGDE